ncbi:MAG TPA: permease-like cell division protein FtsX [Mycobacteriales bacterium]|nr:permease-like cell division protein FtsX [Mycobacteriales bacterium]
MSRQPAAALALAALALTACGKAVSAPSSAPGVRAAPHLAAFLRQSIATPSTCTTEDASTFEQRRSPWVGTVDVSVYLTPGADPGDIKQIGQVLHRSPIVEHTYFESRTEAFEEFRRTYTCWAQVPRSQIPASYRAVLLPTATIAQRNALVAALLPRHGVDSVSCDPSLPCTDVVRTAKP